MDGKQQKKRGQNFTLGEELNLCSIILNYKDVIENKCINKESINEKEKAWREITEIFNASAITPRDSVQLKSKYDNLKSASKKYAQQLQEPDAHISPPEKNIIFDTILKIINRKSTCFDTDNSDESLDSKVELLSMVQANIEDVDKELPPSKRRRNDLDFDEVKNEALILKNAQEAHFQSLQKLKSNLLTSKNGENREDLMNELINLKIQYYKNEEKYHAEKMKLIALDIKIKTLELKRKNESL